MIRQIIFFSYFCSEGNKEYMDDGLNQTDSSTFSRSLREIKLKYFWTWLADQLSQPGWFRHFFVKGNAWGAFSIHSHFKRSDGKPKTIYPHRAQAQKVANKLSERIGVPFTVYKCLFCAGWHVVKDSSSEGERKVPTQAELLQSFSYQTVGVPRELDVERVMATGVPDLAQIYGGFRGRTLSSSRQMYAWKEMMESGINQVIDLRADYSSDFYHELCVRSGIIYFHYPVAYDSESIRQMVDDFPMLCSMIDKGRFYIACAQGLHRTDIALCLYWVFYGADKGLASPTLRGYRRDKGMNADKIMRILNAVYKKMTERNGEPPMPERVFKQRKEVINEQNRTGRKC